MHKLYINAIYMLTSSLIESWYDLCVELLFYTFKLHMTADLAGEVAFIKSIISLKACRYVLTISGNSNTISSNTLKLYKQ